MLEYGYLGSTDVTSVQTVPNGVSRQPSLSSTGEPIYTPAAESRWAEELKSSDGAWRFLKGGNAAGRGVGNVFDATLADNFTVLCLCRGQFLAGYPSVAIKALFGATTGWSVQYAPQSAASGIYSRIDHAINSNTAYAPSNTKSAKDLQWHWHGLSISGVSVRQYVDALVTTATRSAGDLTNTQNLTLSALSAYRFLAATLIYNRVLTDTEVSNIMLGKTMPKEVSGLVGYYKFNETHGTAAGECTDYSGQGNHLTYSGAVWEKYDPTLTTIANFASGQPYVSRKQRNPANWWERVPPAIADPERMGCLNAVASTAVTSTGLLQITGSMSADFWFKPQRYTSGGIQPISKNGSYEFSFELYSAGSVFHLYRNGQDCAFSAIRSIPTSKWTKVSFSHDVITNKARLYLNGVLVEEKAFNASTIGVSASNVSIGAYATDRINNIRSLRLFSRAITAAEVNELFLTDKITNRSGLVGEWMCNEPWRTGSNNIQDTSGNGLHATTTNPLLLDSPYTVNRRKRVGRQLKLDNVKYAYTTQTFDLTTSSVAAWIKWTGQNDGASKGSIIGQNTNGLQLRVNANRSVEALKVGGSSFATSAAGVIKSGTWQLVSADYNGTTINIYVGGRLVKSAAPATALSAVTLAVGALIGGTQAFRGVIDSTLIYNRALTAAEHYALYLDQAPRDGLIAEFLFDDDEMNCQDTSGNGFHATWSGITLANYVQEM